MTIIELLSKLGIPLVQKKSLLNLNIHTLKQFYEFNDTTLVIGKNIVEWKEESEKSLSFKQFSTGSFCKRG